MLGQVVGAVGGSLASGLLNQHFSAKQAKQQMDFQERMSNTQYQRAAADLEKAGLNRVLALGSPASSPSGAMGSATVPDLGSVGSSAATAAANRSLIKIQEEIARTTKHDVIERTHQEANTAMSNARTAAADADLRELELHKQQIMKGVYEALGPQAQDALNSLPGIVNNVKDVVDDVPKAIKTFPEFLKRKAEQGASSAVDAGKRWYIDDVWGTIRKYHPGIRVVDEIFKKFNKSGSGASGSR